MEEHTIEECAADFRSHFEMMSLLRKPMKMLKSTSMVTFLSVSPSVSSSSPWQLSTDGTLAKRGIKLCLQR